jgi:hypothetical protein
MRTTSIQTKLKKENAQVTRDAAAEGLFYKNEGNVAVYKKSAPLAVF